MTSEKRKNKPLKNQAGLSQYYKRRCRFPKLGKSGDIQAVVHSNLICSPTKKHGGLTEELAILPNFGHLFRPEGKLNNVIIMQP